MKQNYEAVELFKRRYGKTPEEAGFPVIDVYKKQHAYLYARNSEIIKYYKTQQNIISWVMLWGMWPTSIAFLNFVSVVYLNPWHLRCVATYVFFVIWLILFIVLWIKVKQTERVVRINVNITYLNYY